MIVAAPPALADLVAPTLAQAQAAVPIVDSYATAWRPPLRYIIYLAEEEAFNTVWFGGKAPWEQERAGYANSQIPHVQYEIVLGAPVKADLPQLVRHEMAHMATMDGAGIDSGLGSGRHEWFSEGIAEHAAYHGRSITESPRIRAVKSYVVNQWAGDLSLPGLGKDRTANPPRNVKYALGHLAVACLVQEYSFTSMLNLFNLLMR